MNENVQNIYLETCIGVLAQIKPEHKDGLEVHQPSFMFCRSM